MSLIDLVSLSPSQLFTADFTIPIMELTGGVKIADTGTGKTISIFNTTANALMTPTLLDTPLGKKMQHQVIVVTKSSLVLDTAKDLSALFARSSDEILMNWNARFGLNLPNYESVPFSHRNYVMSYAQFQNLLLGKSNRGRLFWSGQSLKGDPQCKIAINNVVPTAYHKTEKGYVRGQFSHKIGVHAVNRVVTWTLDPPTIRKALIDDENVWQSIWGWACIRPVKIAPRPNGRDIYIYAEEPRASGANPLSGTQDFDEKLYGDTYNKSAQASINSFKEGFKRWFSEVFNGVPGYNQILALENFQYTSQSNKRLLSFEISWKPAAKELDIQNLFDDFAKFKQLVEEVLQPKFKMLRSVSVAEVATVDNKGWRLVPGRTPKYVPLEEGEEEDRFNPCDNLTVIFDEAHLLVKTEGLEPGEMADFDLIATAMSESNMRAYFFSATLTLFPLMALIQALHPKQTKEGGNSPNRPFSEPYRKINHYQDEDPLDLLKHYIKYFNFAKPDPRTTALGLSIGFTEAGRSKLLNQAAGLLSVHPDIKTQRGYFALSEYGGPAETNHVDYGIANDDQVKMILSRYRKLTPAKLQRIVNFFDPRDTREEVAEEFSFAGGAFDMDKFVKEVIEGGVEFQGRKLAPFCWFAKTLLRRIREKDEREDAELRAAKDAGVAWPNEKLSRITIPTAVRDGYGVNLIAAILQSAGYRWLQVNTRRLTAEQRKEADDAWSKNMIPEAKCRKVVVDFEHADERFHPGLVAQKLGPTERRIREGSIYFVTYSTTLINFESVNINSLQQLIDLAVENNYETPFRGKNARVLKKKYAPKADTVEEKEKQNRFFDNIAEHVIYLWPGSDNMIKSKYGEDVRIVKSANKAWQNVKEKFFFRRKLSMDDEGISRFVAKKIDFSKIFPGKESITDADLQFFLQFLVPNKDLDNEGKKELVQTLKELTNDPGMTNNRIGLVLLGNKFDSGVDAYGCCAQIEVEPYLDWTSAVQRNGRSNRRGGLSELRYERWVRHQYSMVLKWPGQDKLNEILASLPAGKDDLELPTLTSLGIEKLDKAEGYTKKTKEVLAKYTSAVITSVLRNPITELQENEMLIANDTVLEPYQIVRVKAIKNPAAEVLNLIGGLALTSAAFDLPFTRPVRADENPAAVVNSATGAKIPANIPTRYTLALFALKQYAARQEVANADITFIVDTFDRSPAKGKVNFANIVRNASGRLFVFYAGIYIHLDPGYFGAENSHELLLHLVQKRIATWSTKVPKAPVKPKKRKEREPPPLQHCLVNTTFLHHRFQPEYDAQEKTKTYTNQFYTYFEGDREQKSIEVALLPGAIDNARAIKKWNMAVNGMMKPQEAFNLMKHKIDSSPRELSLAWQREIQHAVSVMQYYGLLNWNMAVLLLAGISTSLNKIKENDLIYCALLAAHCYRAALVNIAPLNGEWDIRFESMSIEECTNFLALMASWTVGQNPELSRTYAELTLVEDEPLWKIFSELYYNFSLSIRKNLDLFSSIADDFPDNIRTVDYVDKFLASKKFPLAQEGISPNLVKSALVAIRNPANANLPYNQVIVSAMPANSRNLKIAKFLGVNLDQYAKSLLTDLPVADYVNLLWPAVEKRTDEDAVYVASIYSKEALIEYIENKIAKGPSKLPDSFEYLRERANVRAAGNFLPFRDVNQMAKKQPKQSLILYSLTDPTDLSSPVNMVIAGNPPTPLNQTLLELIKDDKIVYFQDVNPEWEFDSLAAPLIDILVDEEPLNTEAIAASLKTLMNKRKLTAVLEHFNLLFKQSGFLDPSSPFTLALYERFPRWQSVTTYQREVLPLYAALTIDQIRKFQAFVTQVMPRANFYWELFRIGSEEYPAPKLVTDANFKLTYLIELATRQMVPLEINFIEVEEFSAKLRKIQTMDTTQEELLEMMAKVKSGVPGVSLFINTGRMLLAKAEAKFYEMEKIEKQKKSKKVDMYID
jgi:hypothetical protein